MFTCFGSPVYLSSDVYPQNELLVPKLKGVVYKKHPKSKQRNQRKPKKTSKGKIHVLICIEEMRLRTYLVKIKQTLNSKFAVRN